MVIPPARTGKDNNNKIVVTKIPQPKSGNLFIVIPFARILRMVVIKFIEPRIEEAPAKCRLNMAKSTEEPG